MRPVNLATRGFRNDRLPATLVALALAALVALTAWHVVAIRRLLPGRTSTLHEEVARMEAEVRALRTQARDLRREDPPKAMVARWTLVKEIVDQRAFSWTGLFERLEGLIPDGVRLTSIAPGVRRGRLELRIAAEVRAPEDGWAFVRALEEAGDFEEVFPTAETADQFQYLMTYRPRPGRPPASPAATASAEAPPGPAPSDGPPGGAGTPQ